MVASTRRLIALAMITVFSPLAGPSPARCDTVYVVSFTTGALVRYDSADPAGTRAELVAGGQLEKPAALALGPDGNLYIGTSGDGGLVAPAVARYDLAASSLSTVYSFEEFDVFPGSLAFRGNDLLVGRNPLYRNTGAVVRLANAIGGPVAASVYTSGGTGLASSPGLALAADGSLYVSDQTYDFATGIASGPVRRFDAQGVYVDDVIADGAGGLAGPTGLVIRGTTLYTANIGPGTILQTDLESDATQPFAASGALFNVGVLAGLADGGLLAGSPAGNGTIYRFAADGALVETYASGLGQIGGIVTVPEPGPVVMLGTAAIVGAWLARRRRPRRAAAR
jgi:sugar lactone lactonase YvrE